MKDVITFDKNSLPMILSAFGMEIDDDGFISKGGVRITDMNGDYLRAKDFGGIKKRGEGHCIFSHSIVDLIQLKDEMEAKHGQKN